MWEEETKRGENDGRGTKNYEKIKKNLCESVGETRRFEKAKKQTKWRRKKRNTERGEEQKKI